MKQMAEDQLGVHILGPTYFGARQVGLKPDRKIMTPADMAGIKLRMPGGEAWQFLGEALGMRSLIPAMRSEEHTSELQSIMRISYAVFCLKKQQCTHKYISYIYTPKRQSQLTQETYAFS